MGADAEDSIPENKTEDITHGICDQCAFHLNASVGMHLSDYLEKHTFPIVLLNNEGTVKSGNAKARELLNKNFEQITGLPGGNVFECEYAYLPEGCGKTSHCSSCSIRNLVMKSFDINIGLKHQEVYLRQRLPSNNHQNIKFIVSTEKVKDTVLLVIESVVMADSNLNDIN